MIEHDAWVDLALRLGWARERGLAPKLLPPRREHETRCQCLECEAAVKAPIPHRRAPREAGRDVLDSLRALSSDRAVTTGEIADHTGRPRQEVRRALLRLVRLGLAEGQARAGCRGSTWVAT